MYCLRGSNREAAPQTIHKPARRCARLSPKHVKFADRRLSTRRTGEHVRITRNATGCQTPDWFFQVIGRLHGQVDLNAGLGVHQFNTIVCPAVTAAGRVLLPSLTVYFPAGKETGWLTCLDASCVPEPSSTA